MTGGSWSNNVQQFVAIGLRLKAEGHRVQIATTSGFREHVVGGGLKFYPLGGQASSMNKLVFHSSKQLSKEESKYWFEQVHKDVWL